MFDINIDTNAVVTNLNEFKKQINEMDTLLKNVKVKLDDVKNYWYGEEGEEVTLKMDEFSKTFEDITKKTTTFTNFLDYTVQKYEKLENKNIEKQDYLAT